MPTVRVCYVSPVGFIGGAELSLLELLAQLDRAHFDPELVCLGDGDLVAAVAALSVPVRLWPLPRAVHRLSFRGRRSGPGPLLLALPGLLAFTVRMAVHLRRMGAQLVHTNGTKAHVIGGLAGRLARVPVLWHIRDFLGEGRLERLLLWMGCRVPARIVTNSRAVARSWWERGFSTTQVVAVHNGVDAAQYEGRGGAAVRAAWGISDRAPLVGLIGMLAPWKGQMEFLKAACMVLNSAPEARFVIVGAEPYLTDGHGQFERNLRLRAQELGLSNSVVFAGYRRDIPEVLAALDVVVHASTEPEPFGRVLIEAMAARRALVATDAGAVREILGDGEAGLLVPPGAVADLAAAILELVRDPARRGRLAEAGWSRVRQHFTIQAHARRIEQAYRDVLGITG